MADFTAAGWTLSDIITKVRGTTGNPDASMMSDQTIVNYINRYYQYVLPKELKIFFGYTYYTFFTESGVDQYIPPTSMPATFQTVNPQVYVDGFPMDWYLSPDLFFQDYPQQINKQVMAEGDGIETNFPFTVPAFPILVGSLYVTDGTQIAQDNGDGGFTGDGTGTINYVTGFVNVTFNSAPPANANITESSQTYTPNRPQGILFFNNTFTLRCVPDNVYLVKMQGINIPTALVNRADTPFRTDLGPLIAFGASIEIFSDFERIDQIDHYTGQYLRYKDICMQDTYEEYIYERSVSKF